MTKKTLTLHHGAILMLMVRYDGRKTPEIAEALGYSPDVFDTGDLISAVRDMQAQNEVRDARSTSDRALISYLEKEVSALRAEAEVSRADREACRAKIDAITEKLRAAEQENVFLRSKQSRN